MGSRMGIRPGGTYGDFANQMAGRPLSQPRNHCRVVARLLKPPHLLQLRDLLQMPMCHPPRHSNNKNIQVTAVTFRLLNPVDIWRVERAAASSMCHCEYRRYKVKHIRSWPWPRTTQTFQKKKYRGTEQTISLNILHAYIFIYLSLQNNTDSTFSDCAPK